jgi:hypothetical protein
MSIDSQSRKISKSLIGSKSTISDSRQKVEIVGKYMEAKKAEGELNHHTSASV